MINSRGLEGGMESTVTGDSFQQIFIVIPALFSVGRSDL